MGCCFSNSAEVSPAGEGEKDYLLSDKEPITPANSRKCRDVFWLMLFIIFWLGMGCIGVFSFIYGDIDKILYGIDSMGNLCGSSSNTWNGTKGPNLSDRTKLYYLDPSQLWDTFNLPWAKAVCLEECPPPSSYCNQVSHLTEACNNSSQFRCPYYFGAEYDLYGFLPGITDPKDTQYFGELANTTQTDCQVDAKVLGDFSSLVGNSLSATASASPDMPAAACGQLYQTTSKVGMLGPCYPVFAKTVPYLNRCLPDPEVIAELVGMSLDNVKIDNNTLTDTVAEGIGSNLQLYLTDLYRGSVIIIGLGVVGACILSILWMIVLRYFAGCMAWTTIILINIVFIAGTVLCFQKAGLLGQAGAVGEWVTQTIAEQGLPAELNPADSNQKAWEITAWVALAITILLMLFTILMIKRIKIAVACLKVASQAVAAMPSVLLFPLMPLAMEVVFLLYWLAVCALLYSSGDIVMVYRGVAPDVLPDMSAPNMSAFGDINTANISSAEDVLNAVNGAIDEAFFTVSSNVDLTDEECYRDPNCAYQLDWNSNLQYVALYHFFGLLWTIQFIMGYGYVVIAGAIANYYWYQGDSSRMPALPVCKSMGNALKSLGSIALGSLIVAIIQFIRFILEFIDRRTKSVQDINPIFKFIMCCLKCCTWYMEKIMKSINRNAYIMVAVKGSSYCTSAGRAVTLIISNVLRVAAVNTVGDSLIFMAKLTVIGGCGVSAFFLSGIEYFTSPVKYPDSYLSSPLVPIIGTCLCAWIIAGVFFQVYEMAVDTVLLCFCEDCDTNGGEPKFAPPKLMKVMGVANSGKK